MHLFADFAESAQRLVERLHSLAQTTPPALGAAITMQLQRRGLMLPEAPGVQSLVFYLPFWVQDYLGTQVASSWLEEVAYANACGALAVLTQDAMIDGAVEQADMPAWMAASSTFETRFLLTYARLFPATASFWDDFQAARPREWEGLLEAHQRHWKKLAPFEAAEISRLGEKCAVGEVCITALAMAAGLPERAAELVQMLRLVHIGVQLLDDLEDWRLDLQRGIYTPLITRLAGEDGALAEGELAVRLASSPVAEELLTEAERSVEQACAALRFASSPYLPAFLESWAARIRSASEQLGANRAVVLQRYLLRLLEPV